MSAPERTLRKTTDVLWQRYRERNDAEARSQLLDRYLGLVHHSARELQKRSSHELELDDLLGAGTLGLVQALEGFDPSRGLAFSTYALPRIRGAMLDELRSRDWVPRSVRVRRRRIAHTRGRLQHTLGRSPTSREMADALGIDLTTYWRWVEQVSSRVMLALDQSVDGNAVEDSHLYETIPDLGSGAPGDALDWQEMLEDLLEAFEALPPRERLVLSLYYYEELNLKQIGEVLHVSESRVSQIHTRALKRLRQHASLTKEDR